jgi:hypothetical protein
MAIVAPVPSSDTWKPLPLLIEVRKEESTSSRFWDALGRILRCRHWPGTMPSGLSLDWTGAGNSPFTVLGVAAALAFWLSARPVFAIAIVVAMVVGERRRIRIVARLRSAVGHN